jgi:hypothetical protein
MEFIRVEDSIIVALVSCSESPGDNWQQVDIEGDVHVGADVRCFDANWKLRPIQELVDDGVIQLNREPAGSVYPEGTILQKVKDNRIVNKTRYDFVKEGVLQLGALEYFDDETEIIRAAGSLEELLAMGKIDQQEADKRKAAEVRNKRDDFLYALDPIVTNPLRWGALSAQQQQSLMDYRQSLLDVPQQSGFPWAVEWPVKPL